MEKQAKIRLPRGMGQVITAAAGLAVLITIFGIINPQFFSGQNVHNLLRQIVPVLLIGIGQAYVLITSNIDLSIGSVIGMSCMIAATLMTKAVHPVVAVTIVLVISVVYGIINGTLVAGFKLPPFIATLGTMTIARGVAQIVNNNMNTDSIAKVPAIEGAAKAFRNFFYLGKFLGVYTPIWIALFVFIAFFILLNMTRTGRHIYAIGSNEEAARLSGVNVLTTTIKAYVVSSFCATLVGLITAAISGIGAMDAGNGYELYAVAASVIGGVSTLGGQGNLLGVIFGAAIWSTLQNGLQFAQAPLGIRNLVIGAIVIISVLLDVLVRNRKKVK